LVMTRLWEEEMARGSHELRMRTFEELGEARRIVRDHLDEAVNALSHSDRDIAASAFPFLVTSTGSKIAQSPEDLAEFTRNPASRLEDVLKQLARRPRRILLPGTDPDGATRYDLLHDVPGGALVDMRRRLADQPTRR